MTNIARRLFAFFTRGAERMPHSHIWTF